MNKKVDCPNCETLKKEIGKLKKINQVLVERVEHSMDQEGAGYALFQATIALEEKVQERTASLEEMVTSLNEANNALKTEKEKAELAVQAKSSFLARMSHELRTPMNAILGFGQLMQEDAGDTLSDKHSGYLNTILKAGDHLLNLINEVLDLAKIDSGKMRLLIEDIDASTILQECIALLNPVAAQRNIKFNVEHNAGVNCFVKADSVRLKQILINLLTNAIKYNKENGLVTISCNPNKQGLICFAIADQGQGISPDNFKHIFEPFERLGEHENIKGSGMGLAVTRQLVELMGGKISLNSILHKGCTFWFELPAGEVPACNHEVKLSIEHKPQTGALQQFTLLYIEDNSANTSLVTEIIKFRKDIKLLTSETAELGLDIAVAYQPDLILLDIHLPDMNGNTLLHKLFQNPITSQIPTIAISADAMELDIKKALLNGFKQYITKPINIAEFKQMINKYLPSQKNNV